MGGSRLPTWRPCCSETSHLYLAVLEPPICELYRCGQGCSHPPCPLPLPLVSTGPPIRCISALRLADRSKPCMWWSSNVDGSHASPTRIALTHTHTYMCDGLIPIQGDAFTRFTHRSVGRRGHLMNQTPAPSEHDIR